MEKIKVDANNVNYTLLRQGKKLQAVQVYRSQMSGSMNEATSVLAEIENEL